MSTPAWKILLQAWEELQLDESGRYVGPRLSGFPYQRGDYIPVTARYSAMCEHRWAERVRNAGRGGNLPGVNDYLR